MEGGNLDGARGSGNMVQTDAMYQVTITVPNLHFLSKNSNLGLIDSFKEHNFSKFFLRIGQF